MAINEFSSKLNLLKRHLCILTEYGTGKLGGTLYGAFHVEK